MRTSMCVHVVLPSFLALLIGLSPVAAQTTTGSLLGRVTDASGAVRPGATVELSGQAQIGGVQSTTTDPNGS
jgi:hypothetical protein